MDQNQPKESAIAATRQETMASVGRVIAAAASNGVTSPLRLVYLAVRARAEVPRLILEYGKVEYVDVSVQQQFEAPWGKVKRQNMVPFGQLPVLDVGGGELIAQEAAIARYCATLVPGLMPSDPIGQAKCDALFHAAEELAETNPLVNALRGEDFERRKKEFFDKEFPRRLANFSRIMLAASGGPSLEEKSPNYADFKLYHHLSNAALLEPGCLSAVARRRGRHDRFHGGGGELGWDCCVPEREATGCGRWQEAKAGAQRVRIEVPRGLTGDPAESTTTINSLSVRVDGADSFYSFLPSFVRSFVHQLLGEGRKGACGAAARPPPRVTERRSPPSLTFLPPSSMWPLDQKG